MKKLALAILACTAVAAGAYDDGDWQFWNTDGVEHKLDDRFTVKAEAEFRFGDDMSDFYYGQIEAGVAMKATDWFEAAALFRHVEEKKAAGWMEENRPAIDGTFSAKLAGFKISDRSRFEYRIKEGGDDFWRYRNRIKVDAPWKWTRFKLQPYVSDEFYVDFDANEINQNRARAGIGATLAKNLKGDLYYMLRSDRKNGEWSATNILGLALKLGF